jgi:Golgi nucleoside diphosphatase
MIKTYFKLILSDFDKSIIYDQNILPLEKYNNEYTIHYNIVKTINVFKNLLNKLDQRKLSESLEKSLKVFSFDFMNSSEKLLRSYYKHNRDLSDFIEISTMECIVMLNDLWMSLYNKNLFPAYAL